MIFYEDDDITVCHGSVLDVLRQLPDASLDSVVTDPPYGLEFMGKDWDAPWKASGDVVTNPADVGGFQDGAGGNPYSRSRIRYGRDGDSMLGFQFWCQEWAEECLRLLKPGGYILAFGGSRTFHRLACAIEDAGFEIRDSISWLYGSGFPKSMDVSKAIDKAERGVPHGGFDPTSPNHGKFRTQRTEGKRSDNDAGQGYGAGASRFLADGQQHAAAATRVASDAAQQWQGWGTALKPAWEPIIVARKPLIGTVANNVLTHGTGALNIDACRVQGTKDVPASPRRAQQGPAYSNLGNDPGTGSGWDPTIGRWPTNVLLDDSQIAELDKQSGHSVSAKKSSGKVPDMRGNNFNSGNKKMLDRETPVYGDSGGASRFFPTFPSSEGRWPPNVVLDESQAEALDADTGTLTSGSGNKRKKPHQTDAMAGTLNTLNREEVSYGDSGGASRFFPTFRYQAKAPKKERPVVEGVAHPTVKPLELMRWLVRLVTPPGGWVLDPFAGSGTTGEAALMEDLRCVLVERQDDYLPLIMARLERNGRVAIDRHDGVKNDTDVVV